MSYGPHRPTTDEQRDRFNAARADGGLCAACGKALDEGEPVYIERVAIDRKPFLGIGARWSDRPVFRDAPLGAECASPTFLDEARRRPPEVCGARERPVYYAKSRAGCLRATCSRRCALLISHGEGRPG